MPEFTSEEVDQEVLRLAWAWTLRFGEPPPILTEPEMMRQVLDACADRSVRSPNA